jgi:hypothetical protein
MRRLLASTALLFALHAAPALGGGFSTTGLSPLPDGVAPGEPWVVDVTILGHGVTPLDDMRPSVTISRGSEERSFPARPRGDGVYRATVVFPDAGRWRYAVDNGYGGPAETFGAVDIAEPAAATPADGGSARWPVALGAGLVAALLAAAAPSLRRRPGPTASTA